MKAYFRSYERKYAVENLVNLYACIKTFSSRLAHELFINH